MTVIFLDECGHTGQDLLNRDQPFFVLASLALSEDECGELKRTYFQRVRARELKHSSLSRSRGHQDAVMNFLSDIGARQGIFKVNVTHKKYALVGKIVDLIIEPLMYENGIDMYNRGMNIATTNLFYHTIPIFGGEEFFNELLSKFQRMIRYRDRECFQDFFDLVFEEQENQNLEEELNFLRNAHNQLGFRIIESLPENSLDFAFSQAMLTMATWRNEIEDEIDLIHDTSSNMSDQRNIWDALMSPETPPSLVGYDRRTMRFPISVRSTLFESSHNWAGLQLADVVAGAFAKACAWSINQDPSDTYGRDLMSIIGNIPVLGLMPGTGVTPDELETTGENADDPNNYIIDIIRNARNEQS